MSHLLMLLSFFFVYHSGASTVSEKQGGNATLPCKYEAKDISDIRFIRQGKPVHFSVCEEYKRGSGRICQEGACDIIIQNLSFSDAGKYIFRFSYKSAPMDQTYQLHISDEMCVNIGEQLKLDVLSSEADKVQHQSSIRSEWKDVWTRGHGVQNQLLNDRDGNLIIRNFTASHSGKYRVLGSEGETLITVTVKESTGSPSHDNIRSDAEQHRHWIGPAGLPGFVWVVLCLL